MHLQLTMPHTLESIQVMGYYFDKSYGLTRKIDSLSNGVKNVGRSRPEY